MSILEACGGLRGSGVVAKSSYPTEFQVPDFPALAGRHKASILGNNQAFFFVKNPKDNTNPSQMALDTSKLKSLISAIYDHGTNFSLMIDSDVMKNPDRFVSKYYRMRPEPDDNVRKALLHREVDLISSFLNKGGVAKIVEEVIREKNPDIKDSAIASQRDKFLKNNFRVLGVDTRAPLTCATWRVESDKGVLLARQQYTESVHTKKRPWTFIFDAFHNLFKPNQPSLANTERAWLLGLENETRLLKSLGKEHGGYENADTLLGAVNKTERMHRVNFTKGYNPHEIPLLGALKNLLNFSHSQRTLSQVTP